jgi:hypothetical protein
MIDAETVAAIRDEIKNLAVGQWNVDPLFEPDNVARIKAKLAVVDASFLSTAGAPLELLRAGGHAVSFMPNPADPSIERGRADLLAAPAFDLFYGCRNPSDPLRIVCGRAWDMNDFFRELRGGLPKLTMKLCGVEGTPLLISSAYQSALESSAIGLNISRRADHYLYSSDRIAQLAGNGCVVAIERSVGYGDYFGEDEMLFFSDFAELTEKLARLIAEPAVRMRMASASRQRYFEKFNERNVAAHLLAVLSGERTPQAMPW